jgi:uncharacterized protein (TIGR02271 family)
MIEDYDGTEVLDRGGDRIGTVERSYIDDAGAVRFVEVKMRGLRAKHRLVPLEHIERIDDALSVPFSKDVVGESPDVSTAGDTLDGETLEKVRAYYARQSGEETAAVPVGEGQHLIPSASDEGGIGAVRDMGDVIEVPIVEEEVVKRPVVKEVLRIRKTSVSEERTVSGDVRKEEIEVDESGDAQK